MGKSSNSHSLSQQEFKEKCDQAKIDYQTASTQWDKQISAISSGNGSTEQSADLAEKVNNAKIAVQAYCPFAN
jgi:hypothetical protein